MFCGCVFYVHVHTHTQTQGTYTDSRHTRTHTYKRHTHHTHTHSRHTHSSTLAVCGGARQFLGVLHMPCNLHGPRPLLLVVPAQHTVHTPWHLPPSVIYPLWHLHPFQSFLPASFITLTTLFSLSLFSSLCHLSLFSTPSLPSLFPLPLSCCLCALHLCWFWLTQPR